MFSFRCKAVAKVPSIVFLYSLNIAPSYWYPATVHQSPYPTKALEWLLSLFPLIHPATIIKKPSGRVRLKPPRYQRNLAYKSIADIPTIWAHKTTSLILTACDAYFPPRGLIPYTVVYKTVNVHTGTVYVWMFACSMPATLVKTVTLLNWVIAMCIYIECCTLGTSLLTSVTSLTGEYLHSWCHWCHFTFTVFSYDISALFLSLWSLLCSWLSRLSAFLALSSSLSVSLIILLSIWNL